MRELQEQLISRLRDTLNKNLDQLQSSDIESCSQEEILEAFTLVVDGFSEESTRQLQEFRSFSMLGRSDVKE